MKKVTLILLAVFAFLFSQSQHFDGVFIGGKFNDVVNKFKAKGYVLDKYNEFGAIMGGKVANSDIELYIFKTPKSELAYKAVVYLPKQTSWHSIKRIYNDYLQLLVGKYGEYDNSVAIFKSPYNEGDGYETTAVSSDKCLYVAYWENKNNSNVIIEISKYMQVKIAYENVSNLKIRDREQEEIERNVF